MAKDKCISRVKEALKRGNVDSVKAEEIIEDIKALTSEEKLQSINSKLTDELSKKILDQKRIEKRIKERNKIENEIKVRRNIDRIVNDWKGDEEEGLLALLVGSNRQKRGSRDSVASKQMAIYRNLITSFEAKLRENNVADLFANATESMDAKIAKSMEEIGEGSPPTSKDPNINKIAEIMVEFQEQVRIRLNNAGANIPKLWGYIVRQSHDPFQLKNAMDVIKSKYAKGMDDNLGKGGDKNFEAWRAFIEPLLDRDRTFGVDSNEKGRYEFLLRSYNSLVQNLGQIADGAVFGGRDITTKMAHKRVLHFKNSDHWHEYNKLFGHGNLRESFFSGMSIASRNLGLMEELGTTPQDNFAKIARGVSQVLINKGDVKGSEKISTAMKRQGIFNMYMMEVDGSVNAIVNFPLARYSAITRAIAAMAKLGGAAISAIADIHLYASEVSWQGRSYLGGAFEAMGSLAKIRNTKQKKIIAEQLGFINDNVIYDLAARYSVGDTLNKNFTKVQRTFFKLNLLSWWTNTLKEGSMLGMANYIAVNRNTKFSSLNDGLKRLLTHFDIDEKTWDVFRKMDVERADDGKEFFSVKKIDNLSDATLKDLMGVTKASKRELDLFRDSLKSKASGMFLDRSTFAVIEPDARTRGMMKRGLMAGTGPGEAIRFMGQFKAFPIAILQKAIGREMSFTKEGRRFRAFGGVARLVAGSIVFGYLSMTAKDLLRGKSPRDPTSWKTFISSMLQGGGLGIYGDFLFSQSVTATEKLATVAGPVPTEVAKFIGALSYAIGGDPSRAGKQAYKSVRDNIPFLNLFYLKQAFDYMIGYEIMELMSPGSLRRIEKNMEKDYGQEFLLNKPYFDWNF